MVLAVTVLPVPRLADDGEDLAARRPSRLTSVDGVDGPGVGGERDLEVARCRRRRSCAATSVPSLVELVARSSRLVRSRRACGERAAGATGGLGDGAGRLRDAPAAAQARVGEVVEALADQREAEHGEHDREAGVHAVHQMPLVTSDSALFRS